MSPLVESFSAQELPERVQFGLDGKKRKQTIDLSQCQLMQMMQYNCEVKDEYTKSAKAVCQPVIRVFRRCANGVTVETTLWDKEVI